MGYGTNGSRKGRLEDGMRGREGGEGGIGRLNYREFDGWVS